ncbi:uncharacterized protein LOC129586904 [Paramacrobiotus metropolitanus]|uniref:uncharacterized protein LOC129586904 n=1 Tax=Paramacrobiotus metropolitanus TaxID=2943436 RepID=UPI0024462326|nr:uncharacterized protein LOC129586904 [Paramacrobiotus metropolitanus]
MANYTVNCRPDRPLYAGLLGHSARGFGSVMNNALGAYQVAVAAGRRFQLVSHHWEYESLATFFEDFAIHTACPLFDELSDPEADALLKNQDAYSASYTKGTVAVTGNFDVAPLHLTQRFQDLHDILQKLYDTDRDGSFLTKSLLTKAMWQLRSELRDFVKVLLYPIITAGGFIGVHMRRTDKISLKEMGDIPVQHYADKVNSIAENKSLPKVVYIMTDERSAYDELERSLANTSYSIYGFESLIKLRNFEPTEIFDRPMEQLNHSVSYTDRDYWSKQTGQLIVELTILSLADDVVCTMSSNLCRFLALLRGAREGTIHSLDSCWGPL